MSEEIIRLIKTEIFHCSSHRDFSDMIAIINEYSILSRLSDSQKEELIRDISHECIDFQSHKLFLSIVGYKSTWDEIEFEQLQLLSMEMYDY